MSSESTNTTKRSNPTAFSRGRSTTASRYLSSEIIAADIAAFKKRGGSIEVLSTTPGRSRVVSTAPQATVESKPKATAAAANGVARS